MLIKAEEARRVAKQIMNSHVNTVPKTLLDDIEKRIAEASRNGKMEASLNSLSDNGEGVRGIGFYITEQVFKSLTALLEIDGYQVIENNDSIKHVKVVW